MKISIFSAFYPFRGGIAQFSASLYRSLAKKHTVKAYTFKRQYPNFIFPGKTQFVDENDKVDKIPAVRVLDSINPISFFNTGNLLKNEKSNLFISNYWMTIFGPALGIISRKLKQNTLQISILHNVIPHEQRFFDKIFTKFFLKHTNGFVLMSDSVLNDLLQLKPNAKYIRIDHPVYSHFGSKLPKNEALNLLNLPTDKKTLLFFGLIRDYKGLDLLIQAFNNLDDSYQLIIAGESYGSFQKYEQLIENSTSKKRIFIFNKYISDEEVPSFFSAADVCILPYRSATQSGITSICNHFNLPIIATDVGGLKETITHLKTGIIVESPSVELLTKGIELYFNTNYNTIFPLNIEVDNESKSWDNFTEKLIEFSKTL